MMKVCVIGLGYIGLPTAALLADKDFDVIGVDTNPHLLVTLIDGKCPIDEPGLAALLARSIETGRLRAERDVEAADVYIVCVPTPLRHSDKQDEFIKKPDLTHVFAAVDEIANHAPDDALIVIESTIPVGTTAAVEARIKATGRDTSSMSFAYCPERVLPGNIIFELKQNDRIVGGLTQQASEKISKFYNCIVAGNVLITDSATAELCKLAENSYRDVNIALANELSVICQKMQINTSTLIDLANRHPRVDILSPGIGVGGHCIAVDPWFVAAEFPDDTVMIQSARRVNERKTEWVLGCILDELRLYETKHQATPKIGLLGLAYKPDVGDLRESPALQLAYALRNKGYDLICVEPYKESVDDLELCDIDKAFFDADIVFGLVRHSIFVDYIAEHGAELQIIDFCNLKNE